MSIWQYIEDLGKSKYTFINKYGGGGVKVYYCEKEIGSISSEYRVIRSKKELQRKCYQLRANCIRENLQSLRNLGYRESKIYGTNY